MKITRHAPSPCTNCGKMLDAASSPFNDDTPEPGSSAMVCLECGHVMILAEDGKLRDPTDKEIIELAGDRDLVAAQNMLAELKRRYPKDEC